MHVPMRAGMHLIQVVRSLGTVHMGNVLSMTSQLSSQLDPLLIYYAFLLVPVLQAEAILAMLSVLADICSLAMHANYDL